MTDLSQFVKQHFSQPAKEPNTVELELDVSPISGETKDFTLFKALIEIMVQGINILFETGGGTNTKISLSEVKPKQMNKVNDYFRSFGWEIVLEKSNKKNFRISMKNTVTGKLLPDCVYIREN